MGLPYFKKFYRTTLIDYIKDPKHDLIQEKVVNGIQIKVTYRPSELLVYQDLHARTSISIEDIKEARERYEQQYYFILSISRGGREILSNAADQQRFSLLVSKFAFGMRELVTLTTSEMDTLQLIDFHYPRMYGMASSTDIICAFSREEYKTDYLILILSDFGLGTGALRFKYVPKTFPKFHLKDIKIKNNEKI